MRECNCAGSYKTSANEKIENVHIKGQLKKKVTIFHQCNKCNTTWRTTEIK